MKALRQTQFVVFIGIILFLQTACTTAANSTATVLAATKIPISQQVMLTFISYREEGQAPIYTISAQTPMFADNEDYIGAFSQKLGLVGVVLMIGAYIFLRMNPKPR